MRSLQWTISRALLPMAALVAYCCSLAPATANGGASPVLVELFTSEGCNSCPPADEIAISLQSRVKSGGSVIILGEHIDYWDHLGWKDLYSAPVYTSRQHAYSATLGHQVFTPEVIVDGIVSATGNDGHAVSNAINQCSHNTGKAQLTLKMQPKTADASQDKVVITCDCPRELNGKRALLYVAVTEDNLRSRVLEGENSGRTLAHTGVARSIEKVGQTMVLADGKPVSVTAPIAIDKSWKKSNLRIVAFLQDPTSLAIYGANQISLE